MIRDQTRKKSYVNIFNTIILDVSNGQYLSTSLTKFKHIFGEFSINIIYFGESTGILSENLIYLAEELKKKNALRKKGYSNVSHSLEFFGVCGKCSTKRPTPRKSTRSKTLRLTGA
jgi:type II secretory pathway component PulF